MTPTATCSFCEGRCKAQTIIAAATASICDQCLKTCADLMEEARAKETVAIKHIKAGA